MRYSYVMPIYVCILWGFQSCNVCVCADGAATVETHRGELTQAKEQTRVSKATVDKAVADLTAEQAARRRFEKRVRAPMAFPVDERLTNVPPCHQMTTCMAHARAMATSRCTTMRSGAQQHKDDFTGKRQTRNLATRLDRLQ